MATLPDPEMRKIEPISTLAEGSQDHHLYTLRKKRWTEPEIDEVLKTAKSHTAPKTVIDSVQYWFLRGLYNTFNFVTRYDKHDPSPESIKLRLILLESIAGVPPFIMAGYRHFRSLRNLSYDGARIYTHLEEAENERMHLISCMQVFDAGLFMKSLVFRSVCIWPNLHIFCSDPASITQPICRLFRRVSL